MSPSALEVSESPIDGKTRTAKGRWDENSVTTDISVEPDFNLTEQ